MLDKVKLVVADIDGTLVVTGKFPSKRTLAAIQRLHDHQVYFGLASGRSIDQQLSKQAKVWGFNYDFELLIGMNGSELYDGIHHQRYDYYKLKREWIKEILELMAPFNLNPFIYYKDSMLCEKEDEDMLKSSSRNKTGIMVAKDPSELYAQENAKILFRIKEERMPEIEAYVDAHPSPYYKAFKTQTTMLEFADRRTSKAVALKNFCEMNQIPYSQVIAFGDMTNDNEMIELAGLGVCLCDGGQDTKSLADELTDLPCDQDGFADYLEKYLFTKEGY